MPDRLKEFWRRRVWLDVRRQLHPETEVLVGDRRISVDLRDRVIGTLLYTDRTYESTLERLLRSADLRNSIALDVGANIGLHTTLLSELVGEAGQVFAFEPAPRNFQLLTRNLHRNGCRNVKALQAAVGAASGTCQLALHPENYGDHRVAHDTGSGERVAVPVAAVDDVVGHVKPGAISLIKIDVQGYEMEVLAGMTETLARHPEVILILEVFPEGLVQAGTSASQLVQHLAELGFGGWEFEASRLIPLGKSWTYDYIFDGKYADLILCRNHQKLRTVLNRAYGCEIPESKPIESLLSV